VLAHGADKKRIGTNQLHDKDVDGKEFVKERMELARSESSFWQSYKFLNPVTSTIEPKQMYCERLNDTVVWGGLSVLIHGKPKLSPPPPGSLLIAPR